MKITLNKNQYDLLAGRQRALIAATARQDKAQALLEAERVAVSSQLSSLTEAINFLTLEANGEKAPEKWSSLDIRQVENGEYLLEITPLVEPKLIQE